MIYTSHGLMTAADLAETLRDMDLGVSTIEPHEPPAWFEGTVHPLAVCPVCNALVWTHESVTGPDAGNWPESIYACVDGAGEPHQLPEPAYNPW